MGMTLKQFAKSEFLDALEHYRQALKAGDSGAIVRASVRVWNARTNVPRSWHGAINRAYRANGQA